MTGQDITKFIKQNPLSITCGILSLLLIAALYFRGDAMPKAEAALVEKSAEAEKLAANIQYGAQLKEQLDALTKANKQIESRVVRASELGKNTQYFYKIESDTDVKMIDLRQTTPTIVAKPAKASYLPVAFAVSVTGDLNHILTFLRHVENGAHYCRVMSATCNGNPTQRNSPLTMSLSVELLGMP
jgi:hypothetical protein